MNGRDCGALGWSVDAVKIGSRVHKRPKRKDWRREK
jgi:hypothetical protein